MLDVHNRGMWFDEMRWRTVGPAAITSHERVDELPETTCVRVMNCTDL